MASWPGNPIGSMFAEVYSSLGGIGTDCSAGFNTNGTQQTVSDVNITFTVNIEYYDHSTFSGLGYFSMELFKITPNGPQSMDWEFKYLPSDQKPRNGHWWDTLSVSVTMTDPIEQYEIHIHVNTKGAPFGTSENEIQYFQAIQGVAAIGDFTLDFVPLTIVYCPPDQDMTNALSQTSSFGSQFTLGNSSSFQSDTSVTLKIDFLGLIGEGVGFSNSQSVSNQSAGGIKVSHFRNTVVTADNQKAIGRAYWGPLNDVFVILVNPNFAASRRADGTILYCTQNIEQVLVIPARLLLRPGNDPIANLIPADSRQRLLQLDPFITNLNLFFPDSGADLAQAANPYADPAANNRASLLGRWWLDAGSVINYSVGETIQLTQTETSQVNYSSGVSINASAGVNFNDLAAALGVGQSSTTTVGMQSSSENDAGYSYNAACYLIRNQNERDLDGIELYFDKIFSTFMFRRLCAEEPAQPNLGAAALAGTIYATDGVRLSAITLSLIDSQGNEYRTGTRNDGGYSFYNIPAGHYTLVAGDRRQAVTVSAEARAVNPVRLDVANVRRPIDLQRSPVWEVSRALGLSSETVRQIIPNLPEGADLRLVGKRAGVDPRTIRRWQGSVVLQSAPALKRAPRRQGAGGDRARRNARQRKPRRGK
jgi:hypothetical protein